MLGNKNAATQCEISPMSNSATISISHRNFNADTSTLTIAVPCLICAPLSRPWFSMWASHWTVGHVCTLSPISIRPSAFSTAIQRACDDQSMWNREVPYGSVIWIRSTKRLVYAPSCQCEWNVGAQIVTRQYCLIFLFLYTNVGRVNRN